MFDALYQKTALYRGTGVVLFHLAPDTGIQYCLFENQLKAERIRELYESADDLNGNRASIPSTYLGGLHAIEQQGGSRRHVLTVRERVHLCGETRKKHLHFPVSQGTVK
jgi:hypothetical protein